MIHSHNSCLEKIYITTNCTCSLCIHAVAMHFAGGGEYNGDKVTMRMFYVGLMIHTLLPHSRTTVATAATSVC